MTGPNKLKIGPASHKFRRLVVGRDALHLLDHRLVGTCDGITIVHGE